MYNFVESYFLGQILEIREIYYKGKLDKAFKSSNEVYEDMFHRLGSNSPITLKMRNLIGNIYCAMEKYDEALYVHDEVYRKRLDLFGPCHQKTLGSLMHKGYVLLKKCEFLDAKVIFREVHHTRKMMLGPNHIKTLRSLKGIAYVLSEQGAFSRAKDIFEDILDIHGEQENSRERILVEKDLASLYYKQDNYDNALKCWMQIYRHERQCNPNHPATLITLRNIAMVLSSEGKYDEAEYTYKEILDIQKSIDMNQNTLDTENYMATLLALQGEYSTAQQVLSKLAEDSEQVLGPKHSETLLILNNLGVILGLQNYYNNALNIFNKIRAVKEESLGFYHPETLDAKCSIARLYFQQGKYEEALRLYNEVRELIYAIFRPEHPDCLSVDTEIAEVYVNQNKYDKAFEIFYGLYMRKADIYGVLHPYTSAMKTRICCIRDKMPEPRLILATKEGDLNKVIFCLENGDNVNVRDIHGNAPLHIASQKGCTEILKLLLKNSAIYDIENLDWKKPEDFASSNECRELFYLLGRLFSSVFYDDEEVKEIVEEVKEIVGEERAIINAKNLHGRTPLHLACDMGSIDVVRVLLDNGADQKIVSTEGDVALHRAVWRYHYETVETLLEHLKQYDSHEFQRFINVKNIHGATALHLAAIRNDLGIVNLLLDYGANPTIENKFRKLPFDLARENEIKKLLLIRYFNFIKT